MPEKNRWTSRKIGELNINITKEKDNRAKVLNFPSGKGFIPLL